MKTEEATIRSALQNRLTMRHWRPLWESGLSELQQFFFVQKAFHETARVMRRITGNASDLTKGPRDQQKSHSLAGVA